MSILSKIKRKEGFVFLCAFLLLLFVLVWLALSAFLPDRIDKKYNKIGHLPPYKVSKRAQKLYDSLKFISDLHSDTLLWKRDITQKSDRGAMDIDRMIAARMTLQNFTIVNKVPKKLNFDKNTDETDALTLPMIATMRPMQAWFSPAGRVVVQSRDLARFVKNSKGRLRFIRYREDLQALIRDLEAGKRGFTSGMLGIEGLQALEGKIENLDRFYKLGVRTIGLVHFYDNKVAGSAHGVEKYGLTPLGRQVIERADKLQMIVDLAHSSPKTIRDVLALTKRPVISTHTGVKGTCDNSRNLSDAELRGIAKTGGIVGIAFFSHAVCGKTPLHIARAIQHAIRVIGAKHVALGSDWDGAAPYIPFEVRGLPWLVEAMLKIQISEQEIRLVMGENVRDFLLKNLSDRP